MKLLIYGARNYFKVSKTETYNIKINFIINYLILRFNRKILKELGEINQIDLSFHINKYYCLVQPIFY